MLNEIIYIESLKDYVRIFTQKERLIVKGNIGSMMKRLPESQFVRIHRSYAIALSQLKSYNQNEVDVAGYKLPVGTSYRNKRIFRDVS